MAANFPTSALEYELYERIKCEVLEDLRDWLVPKLRTDKIITYLRSKRVFDLDDQELINAQTTTRRSNSMLLDFVIERGSTAFDQFCHAIRENCTGQAHVLEKILIEFERRKQEQIPKDSPPSNFNSISNPSEDPKLLVVTGIPGTDEVDLNNLPGPGDPGAPVPPDEIDNNPAQAHQTSQGANIPPPSYSSESPPPYSE
ncbi:B-cell lymphoma/leukemia 10-like [Porites lutea]|uniref:B-cell lymphoma/leukemia 10-like n=1 Tax=Porites lutea TaxID=51062 RepID=UPI003CC6CF3B